MLSRPPGEFSTPYDMARIIAKLVAGNGQNETDVDYIPRANIIVDDLDYLTQNPFELDEVSDAIVAARVAGILYVTAAGDGGHYEATNSTSNVHVAEFNSQPPPNRNGIFSYLFDEATNLHLFPGDSPYLTVTQSLSDVCLFWNEDPDSSSSGNPPSLLIFQNVDANDQISSPADFNFIAPARPGGCLSGGYEPGQVPVLPVGTKLVIEDYDANFTDRFMIVAEREDKDIVNTGQEDSISGTFDLSTSGAIRGHAYHPEALTVGATPWILDPSPSGDALPFSTEGLTLAVNDYSSDGESSSQSRFYWANLGESSPDWQPIASGGLAAAKPNFTATSKISVKDPTGSTVFYHGTSASAAIAAAVAALYWDFRQWQVEANDSLDEVVDEDIFGVILASTIDIDDPTLELQVGEGVLDGPRGLEIPLPATQASLTTTAPGVVTLNFFKALNDLANPSLFTYTVSCAGDDGLPDSVQLEANDDLVDDPQLDSAPQNYNADPGKTVSCDIVSTRDGVGGGDPATVIETVGGAAAPAITMDRQVCRREDDLCSNNQRGSDERLATTASCTAGGSSIAGWTDKAVTPDTDYDFKVDGGVASGL